jgi:tartrate dehydratase beta subunit/fumarate hydratase class I family protein
VAAAVAEEDLEAIMAASVHIKQVELVDLMEVAAADMVPIMVQQMEVLVLFVSFGQEIHDHGHQLVWYLNSP